MANTWDPTTNTWVDDQTGNIFNPDVGFWVSPDRKYKYVNGQWQPISNAASAYASPDNGTGSFQLGLGEVDQARNETLANSRYTAELAASTEKEVAAINNAARDKQQQSDSALQLALSQGKINSDQYMQQRDLAFKESSFARDLALRSLQEDHNYQISRAAEARQERSLQADLAANPQDLVKYEYYKRALGGAAAPLAAYSTASQFANGGAGNTPAGGTNTLNGGDTLNPANPQMLGGGSYPGAPPAYSDQTLQGIAKAIYGSGQQQPLYNPWVAGTGAFGTQIESPGALSRGQFRNLSDQEIGMLGSFLKGGSTGTGGASIDPTDYFQQVQRSWVPTLSSVGQQTGYS